MYKPGQAMETESIERVIKTFLRKQRALPPDDKSLSKLRLVHLGTKQTELWAHEFEDGDAVDEDSLTSEIVNSAADDAEGVGGLQKYKLEAYFGRKTVGRMQRFSIDARTDDGLDAESSEPANAKGLVTQSMRHAEIMLKSTVGATHQVINQLLRQNEAYAERIRVLEQKLAEVYDVRERLLSQEAERDVMRAQALSEEKRKDEIVDSLKTLLPVVASKVGLLPADASQPSNGADVVMKVKALVDGIKPDQIAKIASVLSPAQQILFMELAADAKKG